MSSNTEIDQALDAFESAASAAGFLIEPEAAWPQTNPRRRKPKGVDEEFFNAELQRRGLQAPGQYLRVLQRWNGLGLRKPHDEFSSLYEYYRLVSFHTALDDYDSCVQYASRPEVRQRAPYLLEDYKQRFLILDAENADEWLMRVQGDVTGSLHRSSKEEPAEFTRDDCVFPSLASMFRCLAKALREGVDVTADPFEPEGLEHGLRFAQIAAAETGGLPAWRKDAAVFERILRERGAG